MKPWSEQAPALRFFVRGVARSQGSKIGLGRLRKDGRPYAVMVEAGGGALKAWRADVKQAASVELGDALPTPRDVGLRVEMTFFMPRPQSQTRAERLRRFVTKSPDLDKLERAVLDALTAVVWVDDSQVAEVDKRKVYADDMPPGVNVTVAVLEGLKEVAL